MTSLPLLPLTLSRVPVGLRQALGQEGVPFVERARSNSAAKFVLFDSRLEKAPLLCAEQKAIDVDLVRRLARRDVLAELVDERPVRRAWQVGQLEAVEEVAHIDKRAVRRTAMALLRGLIERQGGVWFKLAPFPYRYRSAFNFRFDHDDFVAADFDAVLSALRGCEDAASHFVCGSTHERHPDALARLRGMEVGSHGYWHYTYRDRRENQRNIRRGIEVLRQAGIDPSGFVAPHGRFPSALLETLEQLGISHSSEFTLAYDELPFFPRESRVLQIPVHPVSLGVILEAAQRQLPGFDHDPSLLECVLSDAEEYFVAVARAKHSAGEPIFFYCHPDGRLGRYPRVLRAVLDEVSTLPAVWKTTYSRMAAWWRERASIVPRVEATADGYAISVDRMPQGFHAALELWRENRAATVPLNQSLVQISPDALSYETRPAEVAVGESRIIGDRATLRDAVLRRLDWERATPTREIRVRGVRTLVKKTLRYIKP